MKYVIDFGPIPALPVAGGSNIAVEKALDHIWGYGVGPVQPGDKLEGHVDGVGDLTLAYAR